MSSRAKSPPLTKGGLFSFPSILHCNTRRFASGVIGLQSEIGTARASTNFHPNSRGVLFPRRRPRISARVPAHFRFLFQCHFIPSGCRSPCSMRLPPRITRRRRRSSSRPFRPSSPAATCSASPRPAPARPRPSCCRRSTASPPMPIPKPGQSACWSLRRPASSPRRSPPAPHLRQVHAPLGRCYLRRRPQPQEHPRRRSRPRRARRHPGPAARPRRPARAVLRELEILVLDEADQMLDLGFIHALKRIVALSRPSARPCSSRRPCRRRSRSSPTVI